MSVRPSGMSCLCLSSAWPLRCRLDSKSGRSALARQLFDMFGHCRKGQFYSVSKLTNFPCHSVFNLNTNGKYNVLPVTSMLYRRWLSGEHSVGSVSEVPEVRCWIHEIKRAESWRTLVVVLRYAILKESDYAKEFVSTAIQQFARIHRMARAPSSGRELCSLLHFLNRTTKTNDWLDYFKEHVLYDLSSYSVELLAADQLLGGDIGHFLKTFSMLVKRNDIAADRWAILQPLVDELRDQVDYGDWFSQCSLFRGLVGAARLRSLSVLPLITLLGEKVRTNGFKLQGEEFADVFEACIKRCFGEQLLWSALEQFCARVWQHDMQLLLRALGQWSLHPQTFTDDRVKFVLAVAEHRFAAVREKIPHVEIARLAYSFNCLNYQAKFLKFRQELLERINYLRISECLSLFEYVVRKDVVNNELLECILAFAKQHLYQFSTRELRALLYVLTHEHLSGLQAIQKLANLLALAVRRLVHDGKLTPSDAGFIMYCLVFMRSEDEQLQLELIQIALDRFSEMDGKSMSQFVFGISCLRDKHQYGWALRKELHTRLCTNRYSHPWTLDLKSAMVLSRALCRLQLVDYNWLGKIGTIACRNVTSDLHQRVNQFRYVANIAHNLSFLCYLLSSLVNRLHDWLEANHRDFQSALLCSMPMVKLLWALAVHHRYPVKSLELDVSRVQMMPHETLLQLHNLNQLSKDEGILAMLPSPALDVILAEVRKMHNKPMPAVVLTVMDYFQQILGVDKVRVNVVTSELCHIAGAFLKTADGKVCRWPNFPRCPSKADVERLKVGGLQPVAVNVYSGASFAFNSSRLLGHGHVTSRCLAASGWEELVINFRRYNMPKNKLLYLRTQLRHVGVHCHAYDHSNSSSESLLV